MNPLLNSKQLEEAVKSLSQKRLHEFLEGVRLYNKHLLNYQGQNRLQGETVWQKGSARLIDYGYNTDNSSSSKRSFGDLQPHKEIPKTSFSQEKMDLENDEEFEPSTAIFLIPSLINKPYIFDVSEKRSFIRFLKEQGFRVFLMDWGNPSEEEHGFSCTDYIEKYLIPAFDELERFLHPPLMGGSENANEMKHFSGRGQQFYTGTEDPPPEFALQPPSPPQGGSEKTPVITVGYCLGGLFALALAQIAGDRINGLGLLASPWDFSSDEIWHLPNTEPLKQTFDLYKIIPSIFLQSMFILLSASTIEEKFRKLYMSKDIEGFMAIEEWLNDSVDLTSDVAKELFIDWVHHNVPFNKKWEVKGEIINPERINTDTFIAVPTKDQIVPPSCSKPLSDIMPNNHLLELKAGHIGMLVGSNAKEQLWKPFIDWVDGIIT